jgi:hypothetical protein
MRLGTAVIMSNLFTKFVENQHHVLYGLQSLISPQIPGILTPPNSLTVLQTYQQDFVFLNVVAMIFSVTSCSYEILSIKL